MKKALLFVLLTAAVVVLAALYLRESHKALEARVKIDRLETTLAETEARLQEQEKRADSLQARLRDTRDRVVAKAEEVSTLQQAITNQVEAAAKNKNPLGEAMKGMGEMFKKPEMKEFVKTQQKAVLGGMLEKTYAPFFSQLGLTPEQSAALKDLIVNKSLAGADVGLSLMSGDTDPTNRVQMFEQVKAEKNAADEQIKQMLGEDNFKQFQAYEKTMPDRMALNMFKDQQVAGATALTPDQEAQLIQLMGEERQNFKFTTDFSDQNKMQTDLLANLTEDKINQFVQEQEQLHQRYITRAQSVLSADQAASWDKFLASQRQMQAMGLNMASKMFGSKPGQ